MSKNADPKDKGSKDQKDPCRTVPEAWSMWPYCPDFSEKGLVVRMVLTLQDGQMPLFHVFWSEAFVKKFASAFVSLSLSDSWRL